MGFVLAPKVSPGYLGKRRGMLRRPGVSNQRAYHVSGHSVK